MRSKVRRKRLWILVILCFGILFISVQKYSAYLTHHEFQYESIVRADIEASIERVRVSDVIALNDFISGAPKKGFYAYNHRLSDKVGAYRALPDTRDEACRARNYYLPQQCAKVSVIIAFHNEARSTLIRTIMSVYRHTPAKYLHELILLDDHSNDALLLSTLQHLNVPPFQHNFYYATNVTERNISDNNDNMANTLNGCSTKGRKDANVFPVIKMQRNSRRLGLIESRNLGARLATGDYLLFLDSHCEVNVGWLEPLLERVMVSHAQSNAAGAITIAVSPVLDSIDSTTLQYRASSHQLMGGFDWNLHFHWVRRERHGMVNDDDTATKPFKSPVFSGGIFMIARQWFLKLNGFNSMLQIWGGEAIEFSIKLWLCGGQIEIVPCSRVGHIFRKQHPFRFSNGDDGQATYLRNSKIIAESWLDFHKNFYYALKPAARNIQVNISKSELDDFKRNLQCKPFDWYLQNVFPQLRLPNEDFIAFGKLSTAERCLHIHQPQRVDTYQNDQKATITSSLHIRLLMANCYHSDVTHWYLHRYSARLHSSNGACLSVVSLDRVDVNMTTNFNRKAHNRVVIQYCHQTSYDQRWLRRGGQLIHEQTHLCLDNPLNDVVAVSHCRHLAPSQLFRFTMEMQQF